MDKTDIKAITNRVRIEKTITTDDDKEYVLYYVETGRNYPAGSKAARVLSIEEYAAMAMGVVEGLAPALTELGEKRKAAIEAGDDEPW